MAGSSYNTLSIDTGGSSSEDDDARAIADTLGDVDAGLASAAKTMSRSSPES